MCCENNKKVRTRFAPSPTGFMHVGNLRTALYAYLLAKSCGGDFVLRIEDTDQARYVEGAVDVIYATLARAGLIHDEGPDKDGGYGPYVQSERNASGIYLEYAQQLIEAGHAYYCFCDKERLESLKSTVSDESSTEIVQYDKHCLHLSKEEVEANLAAGKPYVIRFNMPTEGTTTFNDDIYGDITVPNAEMEDLILIKSDGFPTYNFANVIDDHTMGITHVVRGNEYLSSAPKYNRIFFVCFHLLMTVHSCIVFWNSFEEINLIFDVWEYFNSCLYKSCNLLEIKIFCHYSFDVFFCHFKEFIIIHSLKVFAVHPF